MITYANERREKVVSDSPRDAAPPQVAAKDVAPETKALPQVLVVRDVVELEKYAAAWEELALAACEANVFYEPWMLLPAMKAFGAGHDFEFVLVFEAGRGPEVRKPVLNGVFPMERHKRYKGLPASALTLWKHEYCMLCTPLVRAGREAETLHAFLDHIAAMDEAPALLDWVYLPGDGTFYQVLVDVFNHRQTLTFTEESWMRAFLRARSDGDSEAYMRAAMSSKRRKEFKRKENRLSEEGELRFAVPKPFNSELESDPFETLGGWLDNFLKLEASGWKGEEGTAFACNPTHQEFFNTITREAYKRGRLDMMELQLDGKPVAAKCDFLAGGGAFAFKIAYDEEYSRFSPGVLLALKCIERCHADPRVNWMDSCAIQDHTMINRLWSERRILQNVVIATGNGAGEFIVSALPLLRWFKRKFRGTAPSNTQSTTQTPEEKE